MKKVILLFIFIISNFSFSQAQKAINNEIGFKLDMYGNNIDGYFSSDYQGSTDYKVSKNNIRNYVQAYYYNLENEKVSGLIEYYLKRNFFRFKRNENSNSKKIKAIDCKSFVIAQDSFIVVNSLIIKSNIEKLIEPSINISAAKKEKTFLQYMDHFNDMEFYKYYTSGMNRTNIYYFLKSHKTATYEVFPKPKKDFIRFCRTHFSEFPGLIKKIENREYDDSDVPTLLKLYKYKLAEISNSKIYFDKIWREVEEEKNSTFYAKVDSMENTSFYITYYTSKNIKLYSGKFTSLYPHLKDGDFTWYFPNGKKRKQIKYVENEPQIVFTYHKNQEIYEIYRYGKYDLRAFIEVNDKEGHNQLDENGSGTNVFHDHITDREIHNRYDRNYLVESYYKDETGRKVFFLSAKDMKFRRSKWFSRNLRKDFSYPEKSFLEGNYGLVLVDLIIEPTGKVSEIKILKGIDQSIDTSLLEHLNYLKEKKYWQTGKVDGERIVNEVVIPIEFQIETHNPFHTWNMFWMNDMMFRQHMMMQNSISTPPPLIIPSNF